MKKRRLLWLSLLLMVALVSGCGQSDGGGTKNLLKVGTDAAYPPFEKQEGNGDIVGFDIDVIKAIAKAEGLDVSVQHTGWDPLFEAVKRGKVDAGISAMTINSERQKKFDFSKSYFDAKQTILLPKSSKAKRLKDLKGRKIGVQSGTTGEAVVQKNFGKTYQGIKGYEDTPSAIDDLYNGRVDAVVADDGVVKDYLKNRMKNKFKMVEDPSFEPEYYGIIVKKGNKKLLKKINSGLKTIQSNGVYDKIYTKYFGKKK
ncbi:amino acid ABC transporter substrate-binding protein, PAAT family [Marininema mesophilum]|uniref:Amino acid ABC transporter substrate-binding protein, PAAT family n=1 Tax=Marininema mesophilum TaxID=1048340 RepID=A0A1H2TIH2_9BACL|nr:basic amino acid ABC transporter substrate-binding protein [Marininema mesophilum]SDW43721.1 amino acid ABC transporter substrate-binding protein, PAAT family [Marininema mesophilum]